MKYSITRQLLIGAACSGTGLLTAPALAQSYQVTDLGTVGGYMSRAWGVNNLNHAVGTSFTANANMHGFSWAQGINDILPVPGDLQGEAFGVNQAETVVGMNYDMGQEVMNGYISNGGVVTPLGQIGARAINNLGEVVGYVSINSASFGGWVDHAARWSNGVITDVGSLGGDFSYLFGINDQSQAVGYSFLSGNLRTHAALYKAGTWTDLGTLGGNNSGAYAISNSGFVVGHSDTAAGAPHAFRYVVDGSGAVLSRLDLGELGGGWSYAYAVNEAGTVVGTSYDHAFIYTGGQMVDLNSLIAANAGWILNTATGINDQGTIVGAGMYHGIPHAYMMMPQTQTCADLTGDHIVDLSDLAAILASYGCTGTCVGDFDGNHVVDLGDLTMLLAQYGTNCGG